MDKKICHYFLMLMVLLSGLYGEVKVSLSKYVAGSSFLPPDLACLRINNPAELTGYNFYRNVAFDPQIAVNPTNHKNIVIVAQQDTLANANYNLALPLSTVVMYTLDGGKTWNMSDLVLSRCQGATNYRANNNFLSAYFPTVSFDSCGNCYVLITSYNLFSADHKVNISLDEGNILAKSLDGGVSWNEVSALFRDDGSCHFLDYPSIKTNRYKAHTVYAVYSDNTCFVADKCQSPDYTQKQYIRFQKSHDEGTSWTKPSVVAAFAADDEQSCAPIPILNQLEVLPDTHRSLLVSSILQEHSPDNLDPLPYDKLYAWRSKDEGTTWQQYIIDDQIPHILVVDPDASDPQLPVTDFTTKDMAVNHCNGHIYIVNSDPRFNPTGQAGAVIRMSKNGGKSWSNPRPINPNSLEIQAFLPTVAVCKNGTVGVLYYDFRYFRPYDARLSTDVWLSLFDKDLNFIEEVRLTDASFDTRQSIRGYNGVDQANCYFDYYLSNHVGLTSHENTFMASYVITNDLCKIATIGAFPCDSFPFSVDFCNRQQVVFQKVKL